MGLCKVIFIYIIWKIVNNIFVYGYFDVEIMMLLFGVKNK